jgi:hypothetical protein
MSFLRKNHKENLIIIFSDIWSITGLCCHQLYFQNLLSFLFLREKLFWLMVSRVLVHHGRQLVW